MIEDYDARTPLHLAACEGQIEVVRYLISKNVNLSPKDRWGNTPLEDSIKFGKKEIQKLLRSATGDLLKTANVSSENVLETLETFG